jgi:exosortase/archaeosortase family protein
MRLIILLSPPVCLWVFGPLKRLLDRPLSYCFAWLSCGVVRLFQSQVELSEATITGPYFSLEVIPACTGFAVFWVFACAVIAFPARWSARLRGVLLGGLTIACFNVVRLASLYFIGESYPELFDDAHLYVFQGLLIILVAAYWYVWAHGARATQAQR